MTLYAILQAVYVVLAAMILGMIVNVIRLYWRAFKAIKDKRSWMGLLPSHVVAISTSHMIFVAGLAEGIMAGRAAFWKLIVYNLAATITVVALWIMTGLQNRRVRGQREQIVTSTTVEKTQVQGESR